MSVFLVIKNIWKEVKNMKYLVEPIIVNMGGPGSGCHTKGRCYDAIGQCPPWDCFVVTS